MYKVTEWSGPSGFFLGLPPPRDKDQAVGLGTGKHGVRKAGHLNVKPLDDTKNWWQ